MKKKIKWILCLAFGGQVLLASVLLVRLVFLYAKPDTWLDVFGLALGSILLLLVAGLFLACLAAKKIYAVSIKPLRSMVDYLNALLTGKLVEDLPAIEEEEELSSFLESQSDRAVFLAQLANVRANETMRRQFSANVSHELKSPLTSINGYAEMIESGMTGEEDTRLFAGIIRKEGSRLLQMINEIIQLSKFDTGYSSSEERVRFNFSHLVEEVLAGMDGHDKPNLHLHFASQGLGHKPVFFYGNRRLLEDVVRNLVSNAIKYSKPEGGDIHILLQEEDQLVRLIVSDTGIGISKENQERVFERFFVVAPGRSKASGSGTGLGLSLVKHIVQIHGGTIQLTSELGQGSRFVIELPKISSKIEAKLAAKQVDPLPPVAPLAPEIDEEDLGEKKEKKKKKKKK